jgi:hypothetical protein
MNVYPLLSYSDVAIPRRTRLIGSSLFFVFCLGGLFWTDYLESKYPQTEAQKQKIDEMKKLRWPTRADFEEARQQAEAAKAEGKGATR